MSRYPPPPKDPPPEEAVEVAVLHVLEDHEEGFALGADAVELDDVFVLQHRQQLRFPLEIQPGAFRHLLQRLAGTRRHPPTSITIHPPPTPPASSSPPPPPNFPHLHGHQHLLLLREEVVTLGQKNLPEGAFAQLPLEHDVPALHVVDACGDPISVPVSSPPPPPPRPGMDGCVGGCFGDTPPHRRLQASQKYWGFSMKLLFSPSSLLSAEEGGLLPKFMKCRDMARSSSWASAAEPCGDKAEAIGEVWGPAAPPPPHFQGSASSARLCRASPRPPHPGWPPGAPQSHQTHLEAESIPGVN